MAEKSVSSGAQRAIFCHVIVANPAKIPFEKIPRGRSG